jgi:lipopolysaccharide biosynthesis glycosyltransferase
MKSAIPIYVGFDPREAACYHVFCESVIERASVPVSFHPLHSSLLSGFDGQRDGSNAFIYSRFLPPYLQGYKDWAVFADGDMTVLEDVDKLWSLRDESKAVMVVKHDYKTKHSRKYIGRRIKVPLCFGTAVTGQIGYLLQSS